MLLTSAAFIGMSSSHAQDTSFICVADKAVGFGFDDSSKSWERRNFSTTSQYLINKKTDGNMGWVVKEIGDSIETVCEDGFGKYGFLNCNGYINFQMNNQSLRYIISHNHGYVVRDPENGFIKEGSVTPYLEIGKCSPL